MEQLQWRLKKFEELTLHELYAILKIRNQVFVVEQKCLYQDADDKDFTSFHLCGYTGATLSAYARLLPPGVSYNEASIGRVLTDIATRKKGAGVLLMQKAIEKTLTLFATDSIRIGAQLYLQKFYTSFGFTQTSEPYLEDNIPHIEMLLIK